jgi:hypothetical protein
MQTHELMAWLGPAAEDLTPEQIERVAKAASDIAARYPDPDEQPKREAALTATVQYLLGETTPGDAARTLAQARHSEHLAYVAAVQVAVMLHRDGTPKANAAAAAGVDRMSLLKALGER